MALKAGFAGLAAASITENDLADATATTCSSVRQLFHELRGSRWASALRPRPPYRVRCARPLGASGDPSLRADAKGRAGDSPLADPVAAAVQRAVISAPPARCHLATDSALEMTSSRLALEIIALRLRATLTDTLSRHLADRGFSAQLRELDKAATKSGAPFLDPDLSPAAARALWSHAFLALTRLAALESALISAKAEAAEAGGMTALMRLKAERDALRRAIKTGTIWTDDGS